MPLGYPHRKNGRLALSGRLGLALRFSPPRSATTPAELASCATRKAPRSEDGHHDHWASGKRTETLGRALARCGGRKWVSLLVKGSEVSGLGSLGLKGLGSWSTSRTTCSGCGRPLLRPVEAERFGRHHSRSLHISQVRCGAP